MIPESNCGIVASNPATTQASNASALTNSFAIDRLGFDYVTIDAIHPPAATTSSSTQWVRLAVYEGTNTTPVTANVIIAGTTNTTASAGTFVIAAYNNSTVPRVTRMGINCIGRRRFLYVDYVPGTAAYTAVNIVAHLHRAGIMPDTAAEMGVAEAAFI